MFRLFGEDFPTKLPCFQKKNMGQKLRNIAGNTPTFHAPLHRYMLRLHVATPLQHDMAPQKLLGGMKQNTDP